MTLGESCHNLPNIPISLPAETTYLYEYPLEIVGVHISKSFRPVDLLEYWVSYDKIVLVSCFNFQNDIDLVNGKFII